MKKPLQFSLATLFLLILFVAVVMGCFRLSGATPDTPLAVFLYIVAWTALGACIGLLLGSAKRGAIIGAVAGTTFAAWHVFVSAVSLDDMITH